MERWLDAAGARVFARIYGSGPTVLYWHGIGLRSEAGLTLACAPELVRHGLRIVAIDVPGWGETPKLADARYRPRALADLTAEILDALDVARAAFMGFSWGGDVGLHFAASYPERVSGLVLLDAGYSDPPLDPTWPFERFLAATEAEWQPGNTPAEVVAAAQFGMAQAPPSELRNQISCPLLAVVADGASESDLARFGAEVPQAEIVRVPGAGHDVLADGGPETVERVARWLSAHA